MLAGLERNVLLLVEFQFCFEHNDPIGLPVMARRQVNYVNAAAVAKETGLAIEVAFSERDPKGYLNGLSVEFEIDDVLNG